MTALLLTVALSAPPADCPCGKTCDCFTCPCPTVKVDADLPPQTPAPPQRPPLQDQVDDLTRRMTVLEAKVNGVKAMETPPSADKDYTRFVETIKQGQAGVLCVGTPRPKEYTFFCDVPSGFKGLKEGLYDCYQLDGEAWMQKRGPVYPPVVPMQTRPTTTPRPQAAGTGDHTHTCPRCNTTWGGAGHSHNCPSCGTYQNVQDSGHARSVQPVQRVFPAFQPLRTVVGGTTGGCANGNCSRVSGFGR